MKMGIKKSSFVSQIPFMLAVPALVWQLLFLYAPVIFIVGRSFFKGGWSGFTLAHYQAVVTPVHLKIMGWSLSLALCNATLCALIAYPVAYFLVLRLKRWKNIFLFFLTLPFWTNFLVQAYSWFFILDKDGIFNHLLVRCGIVREPVYLLNSNFTVSLVMLYCYLPFMIMPIYSTLQKLSLQMLEASADLGATPRETFVKITLPLTLSGVRTGFLLVMVPSFGEYVIPVIMGGGRYHYVGTLITDYFLQAHEPALGAAFTCLSVMLLIVVTITIYGIFNLKKWIK